MTLLFVFYSLVMWNDKDGVVALQGRYSPKLCICIPTFVTVILHGNERKEWGRHFLTTFHIANKRNCILYSMENSYHKGRRVENKKSTFNIMQVNYFAIIKTRRTLWRSSSET